MQETWLHENTNLNMNISGFNCEHVLGNKSKNTKKDDIVAVYPYTTKRT